MQNKKKNYTFPDFSDKVVLVTGGTRGIGLKTGLAFGERGARCILTYRWGDHDDEAISQMFEKAGAPEPLLFQADAASDEDADQLFTQLKSMVGQIDIFISNVSAAMVVKSFEDYSLKGLKQSLSFSSWPMVAYTRKIQEAFGKYPKYIMAMSSTGPDHYSYGYDFVAASKAAMETMCRYLNIRLREHGVVINAIRSRAVRTATFQQTFGKALENFAQTLSVPENYWIEPEEIADTTVALCSGYCDAVSGQVINVDRGTRFFDNFMDIYSRHQKDNVL